MWNDVFDLMKGSRNNVVERYPKHFGVWFRVGGSVRNQWPRLGVPHRGRLRAPGYQTVGTGADTHWIRRGRLCGDGDGEPSETFQMRGDGKGAKEEKEKRKTASETYLQVKQPVRTLGCPFLVMVVGCEKRRKERARQEGIGEKRGRRERGGERYEAGRP